MVIDEVLIGIWNALCPGGLDFAPPQFGADRRGNVPFARLTEGIIHEIRGKGQRRRKPRSALAPLPYEGRRRAFVGQSCVANACFVASGPASREGPVLRK